MSWVRRALVLLLPGSLATGGVWLLAALFAPNGVTPIGAADRSARGLTSALALVLLGMAAMAVAFFVVERWRRKTLVALSEANQALREQADLARSIVELQIEWITRYDADLTLTFVNPAFATMMGRTPESLVGLSMGDLMDAGNLDRLRGQLATLTPERPSATFDATSVRPSGQKQHRRWTDLAIFDGAGRPREYLSVGRDVTEQKVAEETGLIVSIGAWVLGEACREAATWPRQAGEPIPVSVNASTRQLRDPGLVEDVRLALLLAEADAVA